MSLKLRADEERAGHKILICCHDTGPFLAHVVDGHWVKSTPIEPHLPVGHNAYAVRGWRPGGLIVWGYGPVATNNAADILQNSKLIIHWASDVATKRYGGYRQNYRLQRFKRAGIRQVVIDPYFNDTAALYGDEWIPIRPETDEALMSAVAYKEWAHLTDFEFRQVLTLPFVETPDSL